MSTVVSAETAQALVEPRPRPHQRRRPADHLRLVAETRRRRARARLAVFGIALITVASIFALVAFHVLAAQSAFTLDHLSKERTNEQLRYERLRDEVARSSSPAAVIAAAQERGLVFADHYAYIEAPQAASKDVTDPAPPTLSGNTYDHTKSALDQNP